MSTTVSFKYNARGLRTRKIVNGIMTKYTLHGKNLVHMTKGNDELHFFYDAQNRPAVVVYNGTAYAYVKNLQGDIIAILDSAGTAVVSYTYDAWGAPTGTAGSMAATLGHLNPFRYRGYVYDEETEIYYLCSRFYCPGFCRFMNADALIQKDLLCCSMYAYCANCPINAIDANGLLLSWFKNAWNVLSEKAANAWEWTKTKANELYESAVELWDQISPILAQEWNNYVERVEENLANLLSNVWNVATWVYDELIGISSMGDLFEELACDGAAIAGVCFVDKCVAAFGSKGLCLGIPVAIMLVGTTAGVSPEIASLIDGKKLSHEHTFESMATETIGFGMDYLGVGSITHTIVDEILELLIK